MLPTKIYDVLRTFYQIISGKNIFGILSGSTSLVLQGVEVETHNDIDILTDEEGSKE